MKTSLKYLSFILVALIASALNSCRVAPTDPDLDAQWQLMFVETETETIEPGTLRVFYCFYRHTANLRSAGNPTVTANLTYNGSTIKLEFPSKTWDDLKPLYIEPDTDQSTVTNQSGSNFPVVVFTVVKLNDKKLILSLPEQNKTYSFRKY